MAQEVMNVLGASRYDFDGISGCKVFVQQPADPDNTNVVGIEVVEYGGPLVLFDSFRGLQFPLDMRVEFRMSRGSRGKAAVRMVSASPARTAKAA